MKRYNKIFWFVCVVLFTSCKNIPHKTSAVEPIIIHTECDSLIQAALTRVNNDSVSKCEELQVEIIRLSQAFSDCQKYAAQCSTALTNKPTVLIDKSKTKIKDSFNDVTKLKNSIQIRDATIDSLTLENIALHGKVKDLDKVKNKNSSTGPNSPVTNKSGNTTSKAPFIAWVIVFVAGMITSLSIRLIIKRFI